MGAAAVPRMCAFALALLLCLATRAGGWRIVGGEVASIAEFPFLASLQRRRIGHCCVANLVTYRWLLTAAHCVSGPLDGRPEDYVVVAGVTNLTALGRDQVGQRGHPDLFVVHPLVRPGGSYDYDLALVRLQSPLVEGPHVRPVSLAWDMVPEKLLYSTPCTVAGWGSTQKVDVRRLSCCSVGERAGASCREMWGDRPLMKVSLPLVDTAVCSRALRRPLRQNVHLCAFCSDKDACQGDSGSALICQGVQVGVVSWGKGCASEYPGVYARVDTQMAWLHQVISDEPSPLPSPALVAACLFVAAGPSLP